MTRAERKHNRRIRWLMLAGGLWLGLLLLLSGWWGILMGRQVQRIRELELLVGVGPGGINPGDPARHWIGTQRMLIWETISFFALLLASISLLAWLYWRDRRRSKSIQAFFASVTHELRTPLTSIRLQTESISDGIERGAQSASPAQLQPLISRLLEDTSRLESQVERTLELARLEGGGSLAPQALRLRSLIDRVIQQWEESHPGKIKFKLDIKNEWIHADPAATQVILRNLIENALKHSGKDPGQESGPVEIAFTHQGHELKIQDNGSGFWGDSRKLGTLFFRGPRSQGAGVGLYLVKELMSQMGGRARFENDRGFITFLTFKKSKEGGPT